MSDPPDLVCHMVWCMDPSGEHAGFRVVFATEGEPKPNVLEQHQRDGMIDPDFIVMLVCNGSPVACGYRSLENEVPLTHPWVKWSSENLALLQWELGDVMNVIFPITKGN